MSGKVLHHLVGRGGSGECATTKKRNLRLRKRVFEHDDATAGTVGVKHSDRVNLATENLPIRSQAVLFKTDAPVVCGIKVRKNVSYSATVFGQKEIFGRSSCEL
jgi:hypothetical protein